MSIIRDNIIHQTGFASFCRYVLCVCVRVYVWCMKFYYIKKERNNQFFSLKVITMMTPINIYNYKTVTEKSFLSAWISVN